MDESNLKKKPQTEREETLFQAAAQLTGVERAAFLHGACLGDAPLRERLDLLLAAHDKKDSCLELETPQPASKSAQTIKLDVTDSPADESVGMKIGRYKVLEKVGEGGCGVVYVAEQTEPVRRRVALKVIKLGMDTKQVVARFEAERQALAMMDHPNIAKVLDAGTTETGRPYFVMELVRGIRITDYCDQNQLSTKDRLDLFIKVCLAIQHAHQKGIIHRDIKPSNILVTLHDGVPVPKVIDFGIAKAIEGRLTDATVYTQLHQFIGTPAYMSPEQAEMSGLDIDTRSDIYSLGVLLYELLTGRTPFDAIELVAQGLEAMRKTIREEEPVRPSTKVATLHGEDLTTTAKRRSSDSAKLLHQLKGDLDWIVMKCLEKDRTRRYDTTNGLAMDLKRHLDNEPVVARPPSAGYRLQKAWRRNKTAFSAAALIAAVLVAATGVSAWQAVRATHAENLAKQRLTESEAISKFLTEVFQSPDPARDGRTITVAETLDTATKKLETDLATQPARRAHLQATLGSTYFALGLPRQAIALQEEARDYYSSTFGAENQETLRAANSLATSYYGAGRWNEALKLREDLLALRRKTLGPEHPDTLTSMGNLAYSYSAAGRRAEALKLREELLALQRKVHGPEHIDTIRAMSDLAFSYADAGRKDEALKLREEVLELRRKVLGPEHPDTLASMNNLSLSYKDVGRVNEALKLQEDVLALRRKILGPGHPNTLSVMGNLASSYEDAGRPAEALKLREEVLSLRSSVEGHEHPDTLRAMNDLALSYSAAGRKNEALELREKVLAIRRRVLGPEHPDTIGAMGNLALSYDDAGRNSEAVKLGEQVLNLDRKVLGPEQADTLDTMSSLASFYDNAGRHDEALKMREQVLALQRRVLAPEHPGLFEAMNNLAESYRGAGRLDEAIKLQIEALALENKAFGPEHPYTLIAMNNLAESYYDVGRRDEALTMREKILPLMRKAEGPEHPFTLITMTNLAQSCLQAGRLDEALNLWQEALPLTRKLNGPEHADTLQTMTLVAICLGAKGRFDEAVQLQEQCLTVERRVLPAGHEGLPTAMTNLAALYDKTGKAAAAQSIRQELAALKIGNNPPAQK
jgi:eukaryotic-like serine/threonine-protein kinase